MQFLRSVADLQAGFQHRVTLMEANFRELLSTQHADFTGAIERSAGEVQKRFWADLERIRLEYERLIHSELRTVRQRAALAPPPQRRAPARARRPCLRLRQVRRAVPRAGGVRPARRTASTCRTSPDASRCSISAAAAASFWN